MQELISKEAVLKLARQLETHLVWYTPTELEPKEFIKKIDSLPTTVHHEYKVGEFYEIKIWSIWKVAQLAGYSFFVNDIKSPHHWYRSTVAPNQIRPVSEHPDIIQARELASRHWLKLTKI